MVLQLQVRSTGTGQTAVELPDPEEESVWAQGPVLRRKMTLGCGHGRGLEASLTVPAAYTHPGKVAPLPTSLVQFQGALKGANLPSLLLSPLQDRSGSGSEED